MDNDCPIGLDCNHYDLMDWPPDFCINKYFCKNLAKPWPIPFRRKWGLMEVVIPQHDDINCALEVPQQYYEEILSAGWRSAVPLPFEYCPWGIPGFYFFEDTGVQQGLPFPVLVVKFWEICPYSGEEIPFDEEVILELMSHGWSPSEWIKNSDDF